MSMVYGSLTSRKKKKSKIKGAVYGKYKPVFKPYIPECSIVRSSSFDCAPSVDRGGCSTAKKESPQYTGTLIKGIATMHKSNAVPVLNEQDATDIARMRR